MRSSVSILWRTPSGMRASSLNSRSRLISSEWSSACLKIMARRFSGGFGELQAAPPAIRTRAQSLHGRDPSWYVPVSLNGKPCKLMLDTGADFIILDSWVPARFGFATQPTTIQANGVGGARKLVVAEIPMSVGGKSVEKQHVRAMAD